MSIPNIWLSGVFPSICGGLSGIQGPRMTFPPACHSESRRDACPERFLRGEASRTDVKALFVPQAKSLGRFTPSHEVCSSSRMTTI